MIKIPRGNRRVIIEETNGLLGKKRQVMAESSPGAFERMNDDFREGKVELKRKRIGDLEYVEDDSDEI